MTLSSALCAPALWCHQSAPEWEPIDVPAVTSGRAVLHGMAIHRLSCNPSDVPENGADVAHLLALHSPLVRLPLAFAPERSASHLLSLPLLAPSPSAR